MKASVVIRSKDEAYRLRLTLASLAQQTHPCEVIVVDDGSSDHTASVIADAAQTLEIKSLRHERPSGRSNAANAGARLASGDILIFLDGDTLAAPDFVASHCAVHAQGAPPKIVRGETWHLRGTRPLLDPETGLAKPQEAQRVASLPEIERERMRVTKAQIENDFASIDKRAQPGIYPGYGPRRLYELEMEALIHSPDCPVLWAAASGANQSLGREAFLSQGGFHPEISINEHRELAIRLCRSGLKMAAATARSYHMTHRSGWRDPLLDTTWEAIFFEIHPLPEVALLPLLWEGLNDHNASDGTLAILTLPQLAQAAKQFDIKGFASADDVRKAYRARRASQ